MIYAIGDLHFDYSKEKPMDIFGEKWKRHEEKIIENWESLVKEEDIVLIPGDISWALKLGDAYQDLSRINNLPGKKIISKGNHDYWWESLTKMNALGLDKIFFLHNNFYQYESISIHGTRGWISRDNEDFKEEDEKIFTRELLRLERSLEFAENLQVKKRIAMVHYPPFNNDLSPNEFVDLMKKYRVDICLYGHLHSEGLRLAQEGRIEGIDFHCISCDYIDFMPKLIID